MATTGSAATVLAIAAWAGAPAGAAPTADDPRTVDESVAASAARAPETDVVTLITGDRVIVTEGEPLQVQAGAGREGIAIMTEERDGDAYVLPADALPLLADGTVDHDLFNVTRLREYGYTETVPLIVTTDASAGVAAADVSAPGARVTGQLPAVDALAVQAQPTDDTVLWGRLTSGGASAVDRVTLDGLLQPTLDVSVPMVGAPAAWDVGLDGAGVTVAVLDTGVDGTHPDLADAVVGSHNFTDEEDGDLVGHGTHVASTIAGSGAVADGLYKGVAPGAQLLVGKVCQQNGCPQSAILAGMQWAAESDAAVVNMSLGGPEPEGQDLLAEAVDRLTDQYGTLFVVAAGNSANERTVESPGTADSALTVAAVDKDDQPAGFSSKGPRNDGALKPDIAAPGVGIVAAIPGEQYASSDGTSMATPHVAGAAAILAQQRPDATPAELKSTLMAAVDRVSDAPPQVQGNGRLDVARAIEQTVTVEPASVSFPRQVWPHDQAVSEDVTYVNSGDQDVTLTLAAVTDSGHGGMFAVSDPELTVPAGGSATVTLTADPTSAEVTGYVGGHLEAVDPAGAVVAVTGFGVDLEEESYDVTLVHTGRDGEPTSSYRTVLAGPLDQLWGTEVTDGDPVTTLRVPAGRYVLYSWIDRVDPATGLEEWTSLVQPEVEVSGDITVEVDARQAEQVSIDVEGRDVVQQYASATAQFKAAWTLSVTTFAADGPLFTGTLGPDTEADFLTSVVRGTWAVPGPDGRPESGADAYHLTDVIDGTYPTGYERTLRQDEFATVHSDYAVQADESVVALGAIGLRLDPHISGSVPYVPLDAPLVRTEHFTTDADIVWTLKMTEDVRPNENEVHPVVLLSGPSEVALRPGPMDPLVWNRGVFGPGLQSPSAGITRSGDRLVITPEVYGDAAGHPGKAAASGFVTVYQDGEEIARRFWVDGLSPVATLPAESAEYRVELDATRLGGSPLSTSTQVAWTFSSEWTEDEVHVPQQVVRFTPPVDARNTVPAGEKLRLPVILDSTHGAHDDRRTELRVEVSFDDGATWKEQIVARTGRGTHVPVSHPDGEGFVSLRATATDVDGGSVEQTIIRAYRFG